MSYLFTCQYGIFMLHKRTSSVLVWLQIAHAFPKLLANSPSASSKINDSVLRVSWAQVSAFSLSASQGVNIHESQSHGHHPTWLPSFHSLIVRFPQFCLPSQSLKNPLAQAHLSASDLVSVHRMSNFLASLGGANCLLITYKLTPHPRHTRRHTHTHTHLHLHKHMDVCVRMHNCKKTNKQTELSCQT